MVQNEMQGFICAAKGFFCQLRLTRRWQARQTVGWAPRSGTRTTSEHAPSEPQALRWTEASGRSAAPVVNRASR